MNEKHQIFYETSLKLVYKKGFKATTMRDLAEEMGCDVSNIYNYIDSKQSLLEEILFNINDLFQEGIDLIRCSDYGPIDQLKQIVRLYVNLSIERPLELSLLTNEWRNLKGEKLELFISEREKFEHKVKSIIREGMRKKVLIEMDLKLATFLFLSALRLLFDKYALTENPFNKIELERQINRYIFQGFTNNSK